MTQINKIKLFCFVPGSRREPFGFDSSTVAWPLLGTKLILLTAHLLFANCSHTIFCLSVPSLWVFRSQWDTSSLSKCSAAGLPQQGLLFPPKRIDRPVPPSMKSCCTDITNRCTVKNNDWKLQNAKNRRLPYQGGVLLVDPRRSFTVLQGCHYFIENQDLLSLTV